MNDFTKDELKWLYDSVDHCIEEYQEQNPAYSIRDKLQSMIENYCEHNDRVSSSDEDGHMVVQCGRCDLVLWHEKD